VTSARLASLVEALRLHVSSDDAEEADRCAMLQLADELSDPLSRDEPTAHFTASAFVVDEAGARTCLVQHAKLGRLLQPGGHIESTDASVEEAALREAREETALELRLHPTAPRPFDLDIHSIPARGDEPEHLHLDVRYLLVGAGEPGEGAAWYELGSAGDGLTGDGLTGDGLTGDGLTGDGSVERLAAKARAYSAS
jgi:ADP-ribose pyrophosphatase YjhB (NUDIX family)